MLSTFSRCRILSFHYILTAREWCEWEIVRAQVFVCVSFGKSSKEKKTAETTNARCHFWLQRCVCLVLEVRFPRVVCIYVRVKWICFRCQKSQKTQKTKERRRNDTNQQNTTNNMLLFLFRQRWPSFGCKEIQKKTTTNARRYKNRAQTINKIRKIAL